MAQPEGVRAAGDGAVAAEPLERLTLRAGPLARGALVELRADVPLEIAVERPDGAGGWRSAAAPPPARRLRIAADFAALPRGLRALRVTFPATAAPRIARRRLYGAVACAAAFATADAVIGGAPRRLAPTPYPWRARLARALERAWAAGDAAAAPPPGEGPLISFLTPVRDAPARHLDALLRSVRDQASGLAELVLSDDGSTRGETLVWLDARTGTPGVTVLRAERSGGIAAATNAALRAAKGRWVAPLDHDDLLAANAVAMVAAALASAPRARFLYTDEAIVDDALRPVSAFCKPAFDAALLSGVNYVNHLSVYDRARLLALGGLAEGFEGAQDHELVLRYCRGLTAEEVLHLPYPAYLWRQTAGSFSHSRLGTATAAARRALALHFGAPGRPAEVSAAPALPHLHRTRLGGAEEPPVTAIVPNRDSPALVAAALRGLLDETDHPSLRVVVVDNGSTDPATLAEYRRREADPRFTVEIRPAPFNFSAMVNRGAEIAEAQSPGTRLLLYNNDVTPTEPLWLREMADCLGYGGVGVVGARLLFPDRRIQHAGVVLGLGGLAGHWFYKAAETTTGPMGRLALRGAMTVVTGACLLTTARCWRALGGFDAARFAVAYNDVDYCARARAAGFGVVWTPFATLIHHESASRGSDKLLRNRARFARDKATLQALHGTEDFEDPAFSPMWSRFRSRPRLVGYDSPPAARPALLPLAERSMRSASGAAGDSRPPVVADPGPLD